MRINELNMLILRGGLAVQRGDEIETVRGLLVTAISVLKNSGYNPELIRSMFDAALAQYNVEGERGFNTDDDYDVKEFYNFLVDCLSTICCYMDDGIKSHSDHDRAINHEIGNLLDLLSWRVCMLSHGGWKWDCKDCDEREHCVHACPERQMNDDVRELWKSAQHERMIRDGAEDSGDGA